MPTSQNHQARKASLYASVRDNKGSVGGVDSLPALQESRATGCPQIAPEHLCIALCKSSNTGGLRTVKACELAATARILACSALSNCCERFTHVVRQLAFASIRANSAGWAWISK